MAERIITVFGPLFFRLSFSFHQNDAIIAITHTKKLYGIASILPTLPMQLWNFLENFYHLKIENLKQSLLKTMLKFDHHKWSQNFEVQKKKNHPNFFRIMKILIWWVTGTYCENVPHRKCSAYYNQAKIQNSADDNLRNYVIRCVWKFYVLQNSNILLWADRWKLK